MRLGALLLACFPAMKAAAAQELRPAPSSPTASGSWKVEEATADSTGTPRMELRLVSTTAIKGESGKFRPTLVLRCREGKLTVRLSAEMILEVYADRTPLELRWNGDRAELQMWRVTPSVDEIIVPDAAPFISRLARASKVRVDLLPSRRKSVTAIFEPAGLSALAARLTSACPSAGLDSSLAVVPGRWEPMPREVINGVTWYLLPQVDSPVSIIPGTLSLRYPIPLRRAGADGEVLAEFVVDTNGRADMATFKVLSSSNELFSKSVRDGVAAARYVPAEIGERRVRQMVSQPFHFKAPQE